MKGLLAIPLGAPFLSTLAEKILENEGHPATIILLPTRRGCQQLTQILQNQAGGKARLLPKILALSDIETGAFLLPGYRPSLSLPPEISSYKSLGVLTQLVTKFEHQRTGKKPSLHLSMRLAESLLSLIEEADTSDVSLAKLTEIVDLEFAAHWQQTIDFLKIMTDMWPAYLAQEGVMGAAHRRRLVLDDIAQHWQPSFPVILAGTTGTRPATARLMTHLLQQTQGAVILPGFDPTLTQEICQSLPPTHPQYTLGQLVQKYGLPQPLYPTGNDCLSPFLSCAMGQAWHKTPDVSPHGSLKIIEARSLREEATIISLLIRHRIGTDPENMQPIVVVTPHPTLAQQIGHTLKRWHILANISQGTPLSKSFVGRFFLHMAALPLVQSGASLLAALKHPLFQKGGDRAKHLRDIRQFEREHLRGKVLNRIPHLPYPGHEHLDPLLKLLMTASEEGKKGRHSLKTWLEAHLMCMRGAVGAVSLLEEDQDGQALKEFCENLAHHDGYFPALSARDYNGLLNHLLKGIVLHEGEGTGSKVIILGTLEARLVEADCVILAGLNEGTWPGLPDETPWLNRAMRAALGLPAPERRIGLSGHDFCAALSVARETYLTRALKEDGAPTHPSRWWKRVQAFADLKNLDLNDERPWSRWAAALDRPTGPPLPRQRGVACPPLFARPTQISLTDVALLMQDPYGFYAKCILNLRPLDPLDDDQFSLIFGKLMHLIFHDFYRHNLGDLGVLLSHAQKTFSGVIDDPRFQKLWWPRIVRILEWFIAQIPIGDVVTEVPGQLMISQWKITLQADRLDISAEGAHIIDYKTGTPPPLWAIHQGYYPQLALEGLCHQRGHFGAAIRRGSPEASLAYWHLTGMETPAQIIALKESTALITEAERGLSKLFSTFFDRLTPFHICPHPAFKTRPSAFAHLERRDEGEIYLKSA